MKRTDLLAKALRAFVASAVKKKLLTSRASMKGARSTFSCSTLTFLAGSPARVSRKGTRSAKTVR
jgi:hypothetical protein